MILDFWYEFASTYSYPAAMRIDAAAKAQGVTVRWRPFLLGPIFASQGWKTSPFNLFEAKGRNMFRDLERICATLDLPFTRPNPFPQNSLLAARVAISLDDALRPEFSRRVYLLEFGEGQPIDDPAALSALLSDLGLAAADVLAQAQTDANKQRLKDACTEAMRLGIYGAPSFVTADGELFWGNDRLDDAVAWDGRASGSDLIVR